MHFSIQEDKKIQRKVYMWQTHKRQNLFKFTLYSFECSSGWIGLIRTLAYLDLKYEVKWIECIFVEIKGQNFNFEVLEIISGKHFVGLSKKKIEKIYSIGLMPV